MKASALRRHVPAEIISFRLQSTELRTESRYSFGEEFLNYSLCRSTSRSR
jgi:hypothetical protein